MKENAIFKAWKFSAMLSKVTKQTGARCAAKQREWSDSTLDKIWGLKPTYTGKVIRRKAVAV